MKENEEIDILIGEINNTQKILKEIYSYYDEFLQKEFTFLGRNTTSAIIISDIMEKFYTCLETLFLRISQFFENSLEKDKWHIDLLHKMQLEIDNIRKPVISEKSYKYLLELLRFRHFKRYYFEMEYDWDKIDYLQKKFKQCKSLLKKDFRQFCIFLKKIKQ